MAAPSFALRPIILAEFEESRPKPAPNSPERYQPPIMLDRERGDFPARPRARSRIPPPPP
jgi:hypothetical protein